jgi:hypothetical protein
MAMWAHLVGHAVRDPAWNARVYAGKQAHEAAERFNPGWLEDEGETAVLEALGARVTPLCRQPGRLVLTPSRLYFQPFNVASSQPTQVFPLDQARARARVGQAGACYPFGVMSSQPTQVFPLDQARARARVGQAGACYPFGVMSSQPTQVFPLDQARWAPGSPPARPGGERGSPRWACTGQRSAPL